MEFDYSASEKEAHVTITKKDNNYEIYLNDDLIQIQAIHFLQNSVSVISNGIYRKIYFVKENGIQYIFIDGQQYRIEDLSQSGQKSVAKDHLLMGDESEICTVMPGKILKILVKEGESVEIRQNLVIVEAMKMENNIVSPIKGKVSKINFQVGDVVDTGQPIIELEPLD